MAPTTKWDETKPAGTDDPRDGDDEIRDFKLAVRERLIGGGHKWETTPTAAPGDSEAGRHSCGIEAANVFNVYESDSSTLAMQIDETGPSVEFGDGVDGSNQYTLSAQTLQGERFSTLTIPLPASTTGVVEGVMVVNNADSALRVLKAQLAVFTAPVTNPLTVDIYRFTLSAGTDPSGITNANTILNAVLSCAATAFISSEISTGGFVGATDFYDLADGDALVFDVTNLNSADGINLLLKVRRIA